MRLFVGIFPPLSWAENIAQRVGPERLPMVRWMPSRSLHMTLKFIGQVMDKNVPIIQSVLCSVASKAQPFSLEPAPPGVFPSRSRPTVFWLGLGGDTAALHDLAGQVDGALREIGIPSDTRPFKAHLTLGRLATGRNAYPALATEFTELLKELPPTPFPVPSFQLVQSHMESAGSRYEILRDYPLGKPCA